MATTLMAVTPSTGDRGTAPSGRMQARRRDSMRQWLASQPTRVRARVPCLGRRADGRLNHDLDPHDRGPQDACGVFGVWAPGEEVAKLSYFGLYALQHRGQESAGIAVSNGSQIMVFKDMGLVSQVFDESTLSSLRGHLAIGHARYSTTGASVWKNAQPTFRPTATGGIALGHNGNLTNTLELQSWLAERDAHGGLAGPRRSVARGDQRHLAGHRAAGHLLRLHHRAGRDGGAAASQGRLQPGLHGRGDAVRGPRPAGGPAAGAGSARARLGGRQ